VKNTRNGLARGEFETWVDILESFPDHPQLTELGTTRELRQDVSYG
jgi:hypothetical protein